MNNIGIRRWALNIIFFFVFSFTLAARGDEAAGSSYMNDIAAGKRYLSLRKYSDAIKSYQDAVQLKEQDENGFIYLGYAYYRNDQPELAEKSYQEAIRLNSRSSLAHYNLALDYWVSQNVFSYAEKRAISELVEALNLDPSLLSKVKEDPKFRGILSRCQAFQNLMAANTESDEKSKSQVNETNFSPITILKFNKDLVKLSADLLKAQVISSESRYAENYNDSSSDNAGYNSGLKKRFYSLGLMGSDGHGLTGNGYFSEIENSPFIFWTINDISYLIDTRKPTQAMILTDNDLNPIQIITAKKIDKNLYYIDIEQDPGSGKGRVSDSWEIDLDTNRLEQENGE